MRILSIGNSFSQDLQTYLYAVAQADDYDLTAVNLFHGGCSLDQHLTYLHDEEPAYMLQLNGVWNEEAPPVTWRNLPDLEPFDIITMQQVSGFAGIYDSFEPALTQLQTELETYWPDATQKPRWFWHETWAYDEDSDHPDFARYDRDQQKMASAIADASRRIAKEHSFALIPTGTLIEKLRESGNFSRSMRQGTPEKPSLCRDGFHLSLTHGRYAAACLAYAVFTGRDPRGITWVPEAQEDEGSVPITEAQRALIQDLAWELAQEHLI